MAGADEAAGVRKGYLCGAPSPQATQRQMDVLAAYVAAGGSVSSLDGKGEESIDRSFERAGTPLHLGE